ncbi:hypothetical protein [Burkholderia multivorans]|uniref:hypothetical protein n=1 Tax=Burkholderia multivorans TaxID=87883 RepID=UPI0011B21FE3|nr:hypothetical protein [Burkholderia multivorans]
MTQTILSREEVLEIAARIGSQSLNVTRIHELNGPTRTIFDDAGLEEFAAAVLERVCGEPVAWRAPNLSGSGDAWSYRDADDRFENQHGEPVGEALYAINGRKS